MVGLFPVSALAAAFLASEFVDLLNFTGPVQQALSTSFNVVIYLIFTWLVVALCSRLSDSVAYAWGGNQLSFDAGVLRLGIRLCGILIGTALLAYGASQIGVPLVGILAGLGVGGIAVALAAAADDREFHRRHHDLRRPAGAGRRDMPVRRHDRRDRGNRRPLDPYQGQRSLPCQHSQCDFSKQRLINLTRRDQVLFNSTLD